MPKTQESAKNSRFKYFFKLLSFMRPYMYLFIPGVVIYSSQSFAMSLFHSVFLNKITSAILDVSSSGVFYALILYAVMFLGYMIVMVPTLFLYVTAEMKATKDLKARIFRCFVKTSLESSMTSHSGEGISVINTDATQAASLFGDGSLSTFLSCVISIVFSAIVIFGADYRLGLVSVAIGLVSFLVQFKLAKPLAEISKERLAVNAGSVKKISNILSGAITIRTLNMQEKAVSGFSLENDKLLKNSFRQAFISTWQILFTTVQGWMTMAGIFSVGGYLVATGKLSFPVMMMVPSMCGILAWGMSQIGAAWAGLQAPLAAGERVFAILDKFPEEKKPSKTKISGTEIVKDSWNGNYTLSLKDFTFQYESAEKPTLNGISLDIKENETVALVGESGSGKSTLLRAIIGMYERDNLNLRIGNIDFKNSDIKAWRAKFSYVDQSCKLFDMTIGENIALGNGSRAVSTADIKEAAAHAYAAGFIEALPNGYETPCGEKGASLSGGQKQRIAIARALVRKSPVLVFDEVTSALDAESEKQVMETIGNLRGKHTILITTHNLNNVIGADRIVVLDKGRIAETGTHAELIKAGGLYSKLYARSLSEEALL